MKKPIKNSKKEQILEVFLIILISSFSGIFAGMGMGGGTFLIPMLSLFFGIEQIICQSTNVVCFIFLAIICSVIYIKNGLIDFKALVCISIPATIIAFFSSFFALKISSNILKICFASFIILIGVACFIKVIVEIVKQKKADKLK